MNRQSLPAQHSAVIATSLFSKMHGLGNDVVVLDLREGVDPTPAQCRALSDRHTGIGCDMILGVKPPSSLSAVAAFDIWTSEGLPSLQCGNGARCVAAWVMRCGMADSPKFLLESPSGPLPVEVQDNGDITIAMGVPQFADQYVDSRGLSTLLGRRAITVDGAVVHFLLIALGNPHAVIEVAAIEHAPVARLGRLLQDLPMMPAATNIGFAEIVSRQRVALRVFEFGAGETLACGTGACAAAATFIRDGRTDEKITVVLPGGELRIHWPIPSGPIFMTGPAVFVFEGTFLHATI